MTDLFIQHSHLHLSLCQEKILVRNSEREVVAAVALRQVENILVFGQSQLTTQLLKRLARENISVYYFSSSGSFLSCLDSFRKADFEKQVWQAKAYFDEDFQLALAKRIIANKIKQQEAFLRAYNEEGLLTDQDFLAFQEAREKLARASSIEEIRGYEGRMAKSYFYYWTLLLPRELSFYGRRKEAPADVVNALLNLGYSILHSFFIGMIRKTGLNQGFGVLHAPCRHHACLASDLMEEWRPIIVDDTVFHLLLSGEIQATDMEYDEEGRAVLSQNVIGLYMRELRERLLETHSYLDLGVKRYSFLYQVEQQIFSLVRAYQERDASLFLGEE